MVFPFDKKQNAPADYIPVGVVRKMAADGIPELEIIDSLRKHGFSPMQIDRAMREALKSEIIGKPIDQPSIESPTMQMGGKVVEIPTMGEPPERVVISQPQYTYEQKPQQAAPAEEITLEEIIEGVVADKWEDFEDKLNAFERKHIQLQQQFDDLRKRISEVEKSIKEREQTLIGKFEEMGDTLIGVEGRIGSMEKVFKDFMPELTENIKSMRDIVERAKK